MVLSGTDVDIFVGLGPYFNDTNGNNLFDPGETKNDDALGITSDLAALLRQGAQVVTVPDDWRNLSTVADP